MRYANCEKCKSKICQGYSYCPYCGEVIKTKEDSMGDRLRALRIKSGQTQENVGEAMGVLKQIITYWEKGTRAPKGYQIIALAEYFNTTCDYILVGNKKI